MNRFGFFGQFIDNKGVDVILDALIILSREKRIPPFGIVLDINGGNEHYATPAYLQGIKQKMADIKDLKGGPLQIRNRGRYDRNQLADRMRDVDWVIAPSTWWEVFGLVASEAWMFGRPVIAADIGGLGERVRDRVDGLKFPARDARALADLMAQLPGDEARWLRMNSAIALPWNNRDMLKAHLTLVADHTQSERVEHRALPVLRS